MTSYAHSKRGDLPGRETTLDSLQLSKTHSDASRANRPEDRGSTMVKQEQPQPAPRPSPDMASEADRATFNARWDKECDAAREARKAVFKEKRKAAQGHQRQRARNINRVVTR